jgi:glycosyltransferase involved in cell wall biosynthesis
LAEEGIHLDLKMNIGSIKNRENKYDICIFHRSVSSDFIPVVYALKQFSGSKIVWDLDDNLFEIPESNPAYKTFGPVDHNVLKMYLSWSDYLTCSTNTLAMQLMESYNADPSRISVLPNLIDTNDWPKKKRKFPSEKIHILWAGSATHQDDLELIVEPIKRIIKERDNVRFTFIGMVPNELLQEDPERIAFYYGCEIKYYSMLMSDFNPDIALAPVVDHRFNRAKSGIKWMENTLAGAATIASDLDPYSECIKHNETGILCSPKDWYDAMIRLIDNPDEVDRLHNNARKAVEREFSWKSNQYEKWMAFFRHIAHSSASELEKDKS